MKNYVCTKELCLDKCDDDGFFVENEYCFISVGSIFQMSEEPYRVIGDKDSVRLDSDTQWLEISAETLAEHFQEITDHSSEDRSVQD